MASVPCCTRSTRDRPRRPALRQGRRQSSCGRGLAPRSLPAAPIWTLKFDASPRWWSGAVCGVSGRWQVYPPDLLSGVVEVGSVAARPACRLRRSGAVGRSRWIPASRRGGRPGRGDGDKGWSDAQSGQPDLRQRVWQPARLSRFSLGRRFYACSPARHWSANNDSGHRFPPRAAGGSSAADYKGNPCITGQPELPSICARRAARPQSWGREKETPT